MTRLLRTPLFPIYEKYGAKTVDFSGWALPIQFSSIQKEHDAVRMQAGLFDVSHMGEFRVNGADALSFIQSVTTNDVSKLSVNQAQYSLMCYPDGGVVDDLLVYRLDADAFMLVVNASNREKDWDWLMKHAEGNVELTDISDETALLALQGPIASAILQKLPNGSAAELASFHFEQHVDIAGSEVLISRTGYTGEDGFELYVKARDAVKVWEQLMAIGEDLGLVPVGLGARDTLRFEARLPLYGQELSAQISPLEAGLSIFVKLDKGEFIGREALQEQKLNGVPRKLVGIEMIDRGIPRSHYPVHADGEWIGEVTTGTQSPTLRKNVGLALLKQPYTALGTIVQVEIRGKMLSAQVVKTPFYRAEKEKK